MTNKRDDYLKEADRISNELKRLLNDEKGWELKKDSVRVTFYLHI
jgi:hypothetical protein